MALDYFYLNDFVSLSKKFGVTFLFDNKGLIIATNTIDSTSVVPSKKTYARRYEPEILEHLDMELQDLVTLTIEHSNLDTKEN